MFSLDYLEHLRQCLLERELADVSLFNSIVILWQEKSQKLTLYL